MKFMMITYNKDGSRKQKIYDLDWNTCMRMYDEEKKEYPRPTIWRCNGNGDRVEGY